MSGIIGVGPDETSGIIGAFPAGHVVQTVFAPTIVSNATGHTTEAVAASVTGQITITSGNGVLIFVQAETYIDRGSGDMGYRAQIRETNAVSGASLATNYYRDTNTAGNWWHGFFLSAYDSSPADTTPDYCMTLQTTAAGANWVRYNGGIAIYLIEVKQ
jgi:hypothetical protein